jgi:hypothetical protein
MRPKRGVCVPRCDDDEEDAMTRRRRIESAIAWMTICLLAVYVPLETYVSWPYGLLNPFYLVDLICMILLAWGAAHSLRARPRCAPGILCAAYAWAASNGWRATFGRVEELRAGGELDYGAAEAWTVSAATALALALFIVLLWLTATNGETWKPPMNADEH